MPHQVFISYARMASTPAATALQAELLSRRVPTFLDQSELHQGEQFPAALVKALLEAKVMVVFAGETYFNRWYCLREFNVALAAFDALASQGAPEASRSEALKPLVIALPDSGSQPENLILLPPEVKNGDWPRASQVGALADLVTRSLRVVKQSIGERLHGQGELEALRTTVLGEASLPPATSSASIALLPLPSELRPRLPRGFLRSR
ncbi:MAG: toll/interleukin-1 receptor domain-containing protein [Actinomycetota bacterium]